MKFMRPFEVNVHCRKGIEQFVLPKTARLVANFNSCLGLNRITFQARQPLCCRFRIVPSSQLPNEMGVVQRADKNCQRHREE